jgi:hypothetical protein
VGQSPARTGSRSEGVDHPRSVTSRCSIDLRGALGTKARAPDGVGMRRGATAASPHR